MGMSQNSHTKRWWLELYRADVDRGRNTSLKILDFFNRGDRLRSLLLFLFLFGFFFRRTGRMLMGEELFDFNIIRDDSDSFSFFDNTESTITKLDLDIVIDFSTV